MTDVVDHNLLISVVAFLKDAKIKTADAFLFFNQWNSVEQDKGHRFLVLVQGHMLERKRLMESPCATPEMWENMLNGIVEADFPEIAKLNRIYKRCRDDFEAIYGTPTRKAKEA